MLGIPPSYPYHYNNVSARIGHFGLSCLEVSSAISLCIQGTKELYLNIFSSKLNLKTPLNSCHKIELPSQHYLKTHGLALLISGIFNGMICFRTLFNDNLKKIYPVLGIGANTSFIYASLLGLQENIRIYHSTVDPSSEVLQLTIQLRRSAMLGILSNLCYITSTAMTLTGCMATVALIIGIIAGFFGILKIIHDYLQWSKKHAVHIAAA